MRKIILFLALAMVLIFNCFLFACATDDETIPQEPVPANKVVLGGLEYSLSQDKSYYVVSTQTDLTLKNIVIASECENLPVKEIAQDAFKYSTMESITIPSSIETIWAYAFKCSTIKKIDIPTSVKHVGGGAFAYCENLEEAIIRGDDVYVDTFCFANDYYLKRVVFLGFNINIAPNAFSYCTRMVEFIINPIELNDDHVQESYYMDRFSLNIFAPDTTNVQATLNQNNFIEKDGFVYYKFQDKHCLIEYKGTETELLILPDNINGNTYSINQYAFYNSVKFLKSVYIPSSVDGVGREAFKDCGDIGFTIYCQTEKPTDEDDDWKPNGWHKDWNYSDYDVVWGYMLPTNVE